MDYQQARQIRNMPSFSDLVRREAVYGGKGVFGSVKEALKQKLNVKKRTQAKLIGIKEKLDPMNWAKVMFGKTGAALYGRIMNRSEADMQYFGGRARPIGGRSYEIGQTPKYRGYEPVGSSGGVGSGGKKLLPILNKMYNFLKKTQEQERTRRELIENKREENDAEDARRHKELIKTIKAVKLGGTVTELKEKKEEGGGIFDFLKDMVKGIVDKAMKAFEWIMDLKKYLPQIVEFFGKFASRIIGFLESPLFLSVLGPALLVGSLAALLLLGKDQKEEIEKNPYDPKWKDNAYAKVLRGEATSVAQATKQNQAQVVKTFRRNEVEDFVKSDQTDAELVEQFGQDRAGLKKWLVENPKPSAVYQAPVRGMGPTAGSSVPEMPDQTDAETARLSRQSAPRIPEPAPAATAEPVAPPAPAAVAAVTQQNAALKLEAKHSKPQENIVNNQMIQSDKTRENPKIKIPPVRNHEHSFQRMLIESTRLV